MAYEEDRLGFLLELRERYGAVVAFDDRTTIVNDVDLAHEVLTNRQGAFAILGNFRTERITPQQAGAAAEARTALGPGLRPAAVTHLGPQTSRLIERAFPSTTTGAMAFDPIPFLEDVLSQVTYGHYFGDDWPAVQPVVGRLLTRLAAVFGSPYALPSYLPSPARLRIRHAYRAARAVVDPLIEARRRGTGADDYVAQLVRREQLAHATPDRLADLVIGSMLAAHRIPAIGVAWALLELANRPGLQVDLAAESLERDRTPGALPPLALAVILEAVRLHPPTWILNRTVTVSTVLDRYELAPGHRLIISPYVIHRDPTVFEDPLVFDVGRWRHKTAVRGFLGFGRGLHLCPGQHLGLATMTYALATIVRNWRLEPVSASSSSLQEDPRSSLVPVRPAVRFSPRQGR